MKKDDKKHWKKLAGEVYEMKSNLTEYADNVQKVSHSHYEQWQAEKENCKQHLDLLKKAKDSLTLHKNAYEKCLTEQRQLRNDRNKEISGCENFDQLDADGKVFVQYLASFVGGEFSSLEDMKTRMRACPEPKTENDVISSDACKNMLAELMGGDEGETKGPRFESLINSK